MYAAAPVNPIAVFRLPVAPAKLASGASMLIARMAATARIVVLVLRPCNIYSSCVRLSCSSLVGSYIMLDEALPYKVSILKIFSALTGYRHSGILSLYAESKIMSSVGNVKENADEVSVRCSTGDFSIGRCCNVR